MADSGMTLFDTPIGLCGIAWGPRGIVALRLPEVTPDAMRARLLRACPEADECEPTETVRAAIAAIVALLEGEPRDLTGITLDMERVPDFHRRVYRVAQAIPPGATLTYGDVARRLGDPGGAQAVGQALGRNPFAIIVPCHRVVAAGGKIGGFSANGGAATKQRILAIEGADKDAPMLPGLLS